MDLVPLVNGLGGMTMSSQSLMTSAGILLVILFLLFSQFGKRLGAAINTVLFTNWRLALLGATGLVLSVASGWTTWDGMSNFTREPILSALVTFGIQGVMLIVAWLIGESFATGMNHRPHTARGMSTSPALRALQPIASSLAGILLFTAIGILLYGTFAESDVVADARAAAAPWWLGWWDKLALAVPIVLLVALLIVNAGSDVLDDYMQSLRIMIRSAVLWLMFLACMATSVFFSFDSLFSTIFPASERQRAAELRAQNQVAGIVNDIGNVAAARRLAEQETLFGSEAWSRYDASLDRLSVAAGGAEGKLQAFMEDKLRERQSELNRFQEDKSSAEAQQVRLSQRKAILNGEIGRLREQASGLAPEVARLKGLVFEKDRELIAKKAETEGEAGGIGVTSKIGRGPKYRELKSQLDRLGEEKRNLELQLREFEQRIDTVRQKLTQAETELTQTDGELAKLKSRSETADRLIDSRARQVENTPSFDASNGVSQLSSARDAFRRAPTQENLSNVQALCGAIHSAMQSQAALKPLTVGIDCDPGAASEIAARVFAISSGIAALKANCVGGDKLPTTGGADALFGFARRCVQDAQLPSVDTEKLRKQINVIELNRDDKAHRFVVTTNAFQDGNKLAYLALAIAIAIDALVFMSGLFGANAVRSPLSDVPSHKGRSARQLEDVVENSLLPDKFENAMFALDAIQPVSGMVPAALGHGWTHEAVIPDFEMANKLRVLKVLNAGATIGAVRRDETYAARYFIRSELLEFLNQIAKTAFENDKDKVRLSELRKIVTVALQPYVSDHADIVLGHMHPISDRSGFSSEIYMKEVPADHAPIVKRALNAGSTLEYVQRDKRKEEADRFYIHKDFYRSLAMISAENPKHGKHHAFGQKQLAAPQAGVIEGGALGTLPGQLPQPSTATKQLTNDDSGDGEAVAPTEAAPDTRGEPRNERSQAAIRNAQLAHLIQALGIDPEAYLDLSGTAFGAALATSEAFKEQRAVNSILERNLKERDRQARQRLESAYEALASKLVGDDATYERHLLADARNEVEQNWQILMLLPNGPYEILFAQLIESYEKDAADDLLSTEKEALLENARVIRRAIISNHRTSSADWEQLQRDLQDAGASVSDAEVVPFHRGRA